MIEIWPEKKKFGICLSHDVDRIDKRWWHCITHFVRTKRAYHLKTLFTRFKNNPYWNFEKIIKIEDKYGVRSTFFFLNESKKWNPLNIKTYPLSLGYYRITDERVMSIIKELQDDGWEIGVHGSYESYKNEIMLKKEKEELEKIVGREIVGIRQHYLNLEIPHTWELQKKVGFKYDASFGFTRNIGFRDDKYLPFTPFDDDFLVIPLAIMDSALFRILPNLNDAWEKVKYILNYAGKNGALVTVLWHQRVFNENEFPGWSKIYEKIIREGIKRNAWIGSCREVYGVFRQ